MTGTLFIFIHGICGSGAQLAPLASHIARTSDDIRFLTLPGHGGGTGAFVRATAAQWERAVEQEVRVSLLRTSRVVLVGHSLGALLALSVAARIPVAGVVCLGTPMGLKSSPFQLRMSLRIALGNPDRDDPVVRTYRSARGVSVRGPWEYLLWPIAFSRLPGVMRRVRRRLGEVHCPVLLIQSGRDETVSRYSAERIAARIGENARVLLLPSARHAWIPPEEQTEMVREIRAFVEGLPGGKDARVGACQASGSMQFSE